MTTHRPLRRPIAPSDPALVAAVTDLFARNPFSAALGIEVVEIGAGTALLSMPIRHEHLNAHGTGHGGAIWTLADLAFGAAAWHRGYIMTTGSDLSFFRPARSGATVYAQAREVTHKGTTGTYHLVVAYDPDDPAEILASGSFTGRWPRT